MTTLASRYKDLNGAPQGAISSGMELATLLASIGTEKSELILNRNVVVTTNTVIPATLSVKVINGSTITISSGQTLTINGKFEANANEIFNSTGNVVFTYGAEVYPEWWGADRTGVSDSQPAFNKMFTTFKTGTVKLDGKYTFLSTLTVTGALGLKIVGTGSFLDDSGSTANNCELNFDAVPATFSALAFTTFNGLMLEDFFISFDSANVGGGSALSLQGGLNFKIEGINISITRGNQGNGIALGNGSGGTAAFMGLISKCRVTNFGNGVTFGSFGENTSLTFQNCYGGKGYYYIYKTQYSSLINCASDASAFNVLDNTGYGYVIDNSNTISLVNCGAEGCGRSAFHVQNLSNNIVFIGPYSAINNQSDQTQGDVISFDSTAGFLRSIEVHTSKSVVPFTGTTSNISEVGNQTELTINGYSFISLPLGVSGTTIWEHALLTINGNPEVMTFTPTLIGWTNSAAPTVTGSYIKNDRLVNFTVVVTPAVAGTVSATLGASTISLPFDIVVPSVCSQITNTTSNGSCLLSNVGSLIYVQTTGVTPNSVVITGSFMQ